MPEMLMLLQQGSTGGGPARLPTAAEVEASAIDARLELASKKAALKALEGQVGTSDAPGAPAAASGRIVIEKDGKTIVLDNPTAEQLKAVGIGSTVQRSGDVSGWQLVALTGAVMWGIVAIVYVVLHHRRRVSLAGFSKPSADADARMARIENAIESVAVEVERISEGQRFTSKLLSEGAAQQANSAINAPENLGAVLLNRGAAK